MLNRRLLRVKVVKAVYAHFKSEASSLTASEKTLVMSIDKTYHLYNQILDLAVCLLRYAENRIEINRQKMLPTEADLNPNRRFVENKILVAMADNETLQYYCEKNSLGWSNYPELIKNIYNLLNESDFYKEYLEKTSHSFKDDQKFMIRFFSSLEENEMLEDILTEQSIYWCDDLGFVLLTIVKQLQTMKSGDAFEVLPMTRSEEDIEFARIIFRNAVRNYEQYIKYVDKFTQNWDVDRIAFMDNVIMVSTISELLNCPTIPVKVTLDEFIEISKYYSTPGSSTFINGVLDKIADNLREEGALVKEGRGLVDDKI